MVTSRSVPQQIEQMLSARAGHNRFAFRLLQIGHVNGDSSSLPGIPSGRRAGASPPPGRRARQVEVTATPHPARPFEPFIMTHFRQVLKAGGPAAGDRREFNLLHGWARRCRSAPVFLRQLSLCGGAGPV